MSLHLLVSHVSGECCISVSCPGQIGYLIRLVRVCQDSKKSYFLFRSCHLRFILIMAEVPTSPLIRLKQKLTKTSALSSETIRVVGVRDRTETVGETPVKTRGCLSNILTRYKRPHLVPSRGAGGGPAREGRLRVPATVSLPSYNLVLGHRGSHLASCYRSGVSRAGDSRPSRGYYNRRSR